MLCQVPRLSFPLVRDCEADADGGAFCVGGHVVGTFHGVLVIWLSFFDHVVEDLLGYEVATSVLWRYLRCCLSDHIFCLIRNSTRLYTSRLSQS